MTVLDRSGVLELGPEGLRGVAPMLPLPEELVVAGIEGMLATGTLELHGTVLFMPAFTEAQEASASDAARAKKVREKRRDLARAGSLGLPVAKRDEAAPSSPVIPPTTTTVTKRDAAAASAGSPVSSKPPTVTKRDAPSQNVMNRHTASHGVTPSLLPTPATPPTTTEVDRTSVTNRDSGETVVGVCYSESGRKLQFVDVDEQPGALDAGRAWEAIQKLHHAPVATPDSGWAGWCRSFVAKYPEDTLWRLLEAARRYLADPEPSFVRKGHPMRLFMGPRVYESRVPPPRPGWLELVGGEGSAAVPAAEEREPLPDGLEPVPREAWRKALSKVLAEGEDVTDFAREMLERLSCAGRMGEEVYLVAPDKFQRNFIADHFGQDLAAVLQATVVWRSEQ